MQIDGASALADTVSGFASSDAIKLNGLNFSSGDYVTLNADGHTLQVYNSTNALQDALYLTGNYTGARFNLTNSGTVDTVTTDAQCFMAGTMIRTPDGEVAVDSLKIGDLVTTGDGDAKPLIWLGRTTISTVFSDPMRVWPIRIKAGALGANVPSRDLMLSPDHAVLMEGILIQAGALVNGNSIVRETKVPRQFVYYHVELDDHALILAENALAETFVDNVDRLGFDNWQEHEALYPDGKAIVEMPYPRAKAHRQVPQNVRALIAQRAAFIATELTDEVA